MHWKGWIIQKLLNIYYKEYKRMEWLKITKGYPAAVKRRRRDNVMTKRKRTNNDADNKRGSYIKPP